MEDAERDEIVRRAHRLAVLSRCCTTEISRRVARKLNRSPLTIQHILRRFDHDNPDQAVFPQAGSELRDDERVQILRGHRRGLAFGHLARQAGRSRADVYRVVVDDRLAKIARRKVKFLDDSLYHQPDAAHAVHAIVASARNDLISHQPEEGRVPRDLPPYLAELYRTLYSRPAQERALFLELNFHKFQFVQARREMEPEFALGRDLDVLEGYLHNATATRNLILRANLRLVVSIARKHLRPGLSLMELISEGNLTLMRAVEGFDLHRGYRFSTYATLALMKGFARSVPQMLAGRRSAAACDMNAVAALPDARGGENVDRLADREQVRELLARLTERERHVVRAYYGLNDPSSSPATYEQVGRRLGLTKQQVRQIEKSALGKLRLAAGALS